MGNFDFLQKDWPALAKLAQSAESYIYDDPNSCLIKLGMLAENIVNYIVDASGIIMPNNSTHSDKIRQLKSFNFLPKVIVDSLYALRNARNEAVHANLDSFDKAREMIELAYKLCFWFTATYGRNVLQYTEYVLPPKSFVSVGTNKKTKAEAKAKEIKQKSCTEENQSLAEQKQALDTDRFTGENDSSKSKEIEEESLKLAEQERMLEMLKRREEYLRQKEENERREAEERRLRVEEKYRQKLEAERKIKEAEEKLRQRKEAERKFQYSLKKTAILNDIKIFYSSLNKEDYFANDYTKISEDIMTFTRNVNNNVYSSIQELTNTHNALINKIKSIKTISQVKAQKRRRNTIVSCLSGIAAVVVFVILLFEIILPTINYNKAVDLLEQNKYEEAGEIFEDLDDFKDSNEQVIIIDNELKYQNAVNLLNNNQFTEAKQIFVELGDFKDSEFKVYFVETLIKYEPLYDSLKNGQYNKAIEIAQSIGVQVKYEYDYNGTTEANRLSGYSRKPSKEGYSFTGWDTVGFDVNTIKDILTLSLKAKYQVDIYTISYIGAKGEYTYAPPYSYTINDSITLPSPLHAGYEFLGWFENDEKVDCIEAGTIGNRIFTAKYEPKQFKIIYNFENGQEAQIQKVAYGEELTLKESNKQGHTFVGWEKEGKRFDKSICDFTQDIILYASYSINTYVIIFDTKGGSVVDSQDVEYLGKCLVPASPTKRGYDFIGWFDGEEAVDFTTSINDNKTFVAKWSAVEYDIIYHLDGATNHINNVDRYTIEDNIILEEPTKRGYDFVGWYADESYTEEVIGIDVGEVGLRNLYANFVPHEYNITIIPKTYTISFDLQGGYGDVEKYAPQVVSITKGLTSPVRPSKAGYFFTGWYTEKECVNLYDFSHEVCLDMTLYAGWKAYSNGKIIGPNYEGILDSYFYSQPNGQRMAFYCLEDCNTTIKLTAWDDGRTVVITNLSNDTILFNKEVAFPDKYTLNFNLKRGDIIQIYNYSRNVYEDEIKISTIYKPYDIDGTVFDCNNGQKIKFGEDYSIDIRGNEGYTFIGYFDENNVQITDSEGNCLTPYNFDEDIILHEVWKLDE